MLEPMDIEPPSDIVTRAPPPPRNVEFAVYPRVTHRLMLVVLSMLMLLVSVALTYITNVKVLV